MEFGLSQDQRLLDESIRKYLSSEVSLDTIRQLATTAETDAAVWQGLSELGLAGVLIPEAHGGAALGMLDAVAIAEALGYAACPGPFLSTASMASYLLSQAGATDPLAAMASGQYRVGIAFSDVIGARKGQVVKSKLTNTPSPVDCRQRRSLDVRRLQHEDAPVSQYHQIGVGVGVERK